MLAASRVLVAISVRSLSAVSDQVDIVQLRILVIIASRGSVTLSELAEAAAIHLSKASRTCDRLVASGLIVREDDPDDRRSLRLTLTASGRQVVRTVMRARRAAITPMLQRLSSKRRHELVALLAEFAGVDEDSASTELSAMGWA